MTSVMDRREFIGTVAGGLLAAPLMAEGQPGKVFQVGFLGTATPSLMSAWLTAFREGLRETRLRGGQKYLDGVSMGRGDA
jgi:hypothetical protein